MKMSGLESCLPLMSNNSLASISLHNHPKMKKLFQIRPPKKPMVQLIQKNIKAMAVEDPAIGHYDRMKELKDFDESKIGVKGLSDSGITSIPRIFVHSPETLSDLNKTPDSEALSIPLIDLSGINSPSVRPQIIDQVKQAAKTWGFFQVINHGIPIPFMDDTLASIKAFHDLPYELRSKHYSRSMDTRAATLVSNLDLFSSAAASWRDTLRAMVGPERPEEVKFPEVCRKEVVAWVPRATEVAESLLELLSEGLGLERGKFKELSFAEKKAFVGHCYPYCPEPDRTVGVASHTDSVILTVLMTSQIPGLQVKYGGVWVDVKPIHGSLIINVGDFLEIASNGEYISVQHRVLANSWKEARISVGVFFTIDKWRDNGYYGPLPELLTPENPPKYLDFTKQDYYDFYLNKSMYNKSLAERFKMDT